ncbi:hypothetical protein FFK22_028575 [Mycobacterium sp. KBS0706]|uniref:type VI toxin-antitoxin system SocB family DNA replication inhibitor toxin n=1 Tax=Mycobacterium sp. KBS0706 TaxID=2578109 RepID=UPI00110F804C|nr:hypothetical protein [Mycobacterium sp. KBS0706]TSD85192.1 hypothetical protein FFK22_028575 [Mycobacterium sp. KBS0706]
MKIRPLPDIDLARIAPLPEVMQRKQLEQIRYGRPPFSYGPLRSCFHDIFNVQPEMFGRVAATEWSVIEALLGRKCTSEEELQANLCVARGLYEFATASKLLGRAQEFFSLAMGTGRKVVYWLPMVLSLDGRPTVPFIDPRRSRGLTREARRFAFSMMHERIRAADPDYETVRFAIFQFGDVNGGQRDPILHTDDGLELFSLDQMESMVNVTYELWREVCEERDMDARRKATGTRGPLI